MTDNNNNNGLETVLQETLEAARDYLKMGTYVMGKDFEARMDRLSEQIKKDRQETEQLKQANEQTRVANEQTRVANEQTRVANEQNRVANEQHERTNELKDRELKIKTRNLWLTGVGVSIAFLTVLISAVALYLKQAT